ncbi:MAG: 50S ribosomal protein L29 [Candidatus Peribacter sp.]|jgi:ribosomal protein L29|nr:50S ribosomal protein L29 [Candidatus Peribacter sp.]MBT4392523.1 50S ribosomal protein L29 [Candidatus Peribacter sp.]MBT4601396.1 50S ribosomal protein L29 [Candidatus Peribacter sp.]MBT5149534.1 50S ribosomal protein L29 [Candidatus Peribacter sp.]MBT5638086.1 50S ribosomal protein L29 [Candidatus Peribacter sp.]
MSSLTTIKELNKMSPEDLRKEVIAQENTVVKLRLGVKLGKEKDSAKYIREKKQLARMKTVQSSVSSLPTEAKKAKVAPAKKS